MSPEQYRQARMDRAMGMIARHLHRGDWNAAAHWMAVYIEEKEAAR